MSEKIRLRGQLKLPVVGKNPTFAQMKFVKVALSEPDILPDSGSIFTCDEQGNYDFEIYTGKHLLSYNVGNAWSKPIEIIAEPLAEGLESIEISDLIGFQEIPELDATIAALNQQKQELLAIQQDVVLKQEDAAASAAAAEASAGALDAVIDDSSFMKRYEIKQPEDASGSGKYSLVMIDEYSSSSVESYEHPLYSISAYGVSCVHRASLIPQMSSSTFFTGNYAMIASFGGADIRIFFGKNSSGNYALYFAFKNAALNSSELSVIISTYKKLTIQELGAVNIDSWLADNTLISEATKIDMVEIASPTDSLRIGSCAIDRDAAENYGLTAEKFDAALTKQQAQDFFESEKSKAILIMNDHMLGTGEEEITDLQVMDVKAYIQSIDPAKGFKVGIARAKVPRPSIFSRYD